MSMLQICSVVDAVAMTDVEILTEVSVNHSPNASVVTGLLDARKIDFNTFLDKLPLATIKATLRE